MSVAGAVTTLDDPRLAPEVGVKSQWITAVGKSIERVYGMGHFEER